jgi:hypothetical protein
MARPYTWSEEPRCDGCSRRRSHGVAARDKVLVSPPCSKYLDHLGWDDVLTHTASTPEQQESDLLFPALHGGYRTASVLNKPFADVVDHIKLGRKFTQRGMRRTFNDLTRAAKVEAIVTRSISGHLTERMQERYSTVAPIEQRESIAKVIDFMSAKQAFTKQTAPDSSNGTHDGTSAPESAQYVGHPNPPLGQPTSRPTSPAPTPKRTTPST